MHAPIANIARRCYTFQAAEVPPEGELLMRWTSALSEQPVLGDAIAECAAAIKASMENEALDLAVAFIAPQYEDS